MTHDELLAKIDIFRFETNREDLLSDALRAVVELHKPIPTTLKGEPPLYCDDCRVPYEPFSVLYPCPTIWAITEQLK